MTAYTAVFSPFTLRHLKFKNRIISTSHAPAYAENGRPKLRYQLYHEEKAKGGLALTMFGGSSVIAPDSPPSFGQIDVSDDAIIEDLLPFAARIHKHGCAIMCQLAHAGRRTSWDKGHWLPPIAPSALREPAHRSFPKEMEPADIRRVIAAYGAAASRCKRGGLDGCEILATSHMPGQFLSPVTNRRRDDYGGTLQNRLRFVLELLEAVRGRVGTDFIVGIRLTANEGFEGGITEDQSLEIARAIDGAGLIDFITVNVGQSWTERGLARAIPGMGTPAAGHLMAASRIRKAVGVPVFHAGRITDLATADAAVRDGHVDMVGMTRAHIADPHLVAKALAGREDRIRTCVGANYCLDRIYVGKDALCIQNAATGREATMPHAIQPTTGAPRRVAVVGAGPAGLEAARVCGERGHRVVLFEAAKEPGGQVLLAAKVTWRRDLVSIVEWLAREVGRLGVETRFGRAATADDVLSVAPDAVIVATGGTPNTAVVEGSEHVASVWDILGGRVRPGENVLVFDDNGQHQGPSAAEFMAERGASVEIATPDRMVAYDLGATNYAVFYQHLYERGVRMSPNLRLLSVRRDGNALRCTLRNEYSDAEEERVVDQVVVEHGTLPADRLYFDLRAGAINGGAVDQAALIAGRPQSLADNPDGRYALFRVGDAVAGRNIHAALYDSLRLCKDL